MHLLSIRSLGAAIAAALAWSVSYAQTYTDPDKAGVEYQIQGEYEGTAGENGDRWGIQVIALGHGEFEAVGYRGGLPGNGWQRGDEAHRTQGRLDGASAVFETDQYDIRVDGKHVTVKDKAGERVAELPKVQRCSPTLGAEPPAGAIVLFDGTSLDGWENAKIVEEQLLGATNAYTKQRLGDHSLHIEFRTPFMPGARGQGRGNSGVYVQSRFEVQVLDSFGLEGKDNECGGIYSIHEPAVNMCFPPLTWQTYDIDFTAARYDDQGNKVKNARITVRHNGVVIHDDLELPRGTPGRYNEGPEPAGLFLQDHGNPVVFRNIWAVPKP